MDEDIDYDAEIMDLIQHGYLSPTAAPGVSADSRSLLKALESDFEDPAPELMEWASFLPCDKPHLSEIEKACFALNMDMASEAWKRDGKLVRGEKHAITVVARLMCVEAHAQYEMTKKEVANWLGDTEAGFNDATIKEIKEKMTSMTRCMEHFKLQMWWLLKELYEPEYCATATRNKYVHPESTFTYLSRLRYRMQVLAVDIEKAMSISKTFIDEDGDRVCFFKVHTTADHFINTSRHFTYNQGDHK